METKFEKLFVPQIKFEKKNAMFIKKYDLSWMEEVSPTLKMDVEGFIGFHWIASTRGTKK